MDADVETREIVRIILMLAHGLGLKVVAEGVETEAQADMLKEMGCELAQGYYTLRRLPSDTMSNFSGQIGPQTSREREPLVRPSHDHLPA